MPDLYELGPLEQEILQLLWRNGSQTVRQVHQQLEDKDRAYTTVMTVMSRMAEKDVLVRVKKGKAFLYQPKESQAHFESGKARNLFAQVFKGFGMNAIQPLVDSLDNLGDQELEKLAQKIQKLRERKSHDSL